ncbi:LytR/AlgR family response regulator transcription factor [Microbulbifer hainanensis]|uniref:LytR/AlgR family response regulator transcription factor n=1 Tax=Microbulbifer hainanensis TaxID=2735675 RepID=UPI0018693694|nr:LytTR family DNA-binding domain-containing protein [Microbulbifer hainanensis]
MEYNGQPEQPSNSVANPWIERFDRHRMLYSYLALTVYLFINNTVNAFSVWADHNRGGLAHIQLWEPLVWEYTSAISILTLLPILVFAFRHNPPRLTRFGRQLGWHLLASMLFSVAHVFLMVQMRKLIYLLAGESYGFGTWLPEFGYEYRKDVWGYAIYFCLYYVFRLAYSRLKGEASLIAENEPAQGADGGQKLPEHFLVKKLDKEFLVRVADIEWIEASGNYVNLHSRGRIYPLRSTLTEIAERLAPAGFSRIHRGLVVNHNAIEHISFQSSGDGEVQLQCGKLLNLSRRYRDTFKQALA